MGTTCPARPLREKFRRGWATASSGCCGGVSRQRGPVLVTGQGPGGGRGRDLQGPGAHVPFPESESELPPPRVLGVSPPIPGGLLVRGYPTHQAPGLRTLPPGRGFEASLVLACAAEPPMQAPGELRSNSTKLAAGCAGLYLAWGGVQGPRPPQLPGAPGCTTASARSPSGQSRPAAWAGGGAATPPRPAPPRQGSPGVPAPRPRPPKDFSTFHRA